MPDAAILTAGSTSSSSLLQRRVTVEFMVALDQTLTLCRQAVRQETEVDILDPFGERRISSTVRNLCHDFHRPA
jgi:hypothetical protein